MKTLESNISYDTIDIFMQNSKSLVHLKNVHTQKYEATNVTNLEFFGMLEETQLIGKTLRDVDKFMQEYWGNKLVDSIEDIEKLVLKHNKPISKKRNIMFNRRNKLAVLNIIKFPVTNDKNIIKSMLTVSEDVTNDTCPAVIYRFYRIFKQPNVAIANFLKHFEIGEYFDSIPSEPELLALIDFASKSRKASKHDKQIHWNHIESLENKICSSNIQNITQKIN